MTTKYLVFIELNNTPTTKRKKERMKNKIQVFISFIILILLLFSHITIITQNNRR